MMAPAASSGSTFPVSTTTLIIIAIVLTLGVVAIIGYRAPDRSPGSDDKAKRDQVDD
jgi:hypothetical protein